MGHFKDSAWCLCYLMLGVLFPSELEMREAGDRGADDTNDLKLAVVAVFTP